ncbi:RNA polymerase sigma-70 factor [Mucilaginibacter koreensis]
MPAKTVACIWSDDQLLSMLRQGDGHAFELIYQQYAAKLYAAAYNLLRNREASEDVVQDLFAELWLKHHQLHITSLQGYLKVATRNRVLMHIRSKKIALSDEVIDMLAEKYQEADGRLLQQDLNQALELNLNKLPTKCREIFSMSRMQQLSNKEIAEQLHISIKTVENQITIALRYLRSGLSDFLPLIVMVLMFR